MSTDKINFKGYKPFGNWVLVKPVEQTEIGGIIIPLTGDGKNTQRGKVVMAGQGIFDGEDRKKMQVKVGDEVMYVKYAGSEVSVDGAKHIIMKDEDILGKYIGGKTETEIQPLFDRVFIDWEFAQDCYKGTNIKRAEGSSKERYYTGVIVGLGQDCKEEELKIGRRIFFYQFCGPERVNVGDKRYAFIWEHDICMAIPSRAEMACLSD